MKQIKQLIKHSGAIHIENNITLVQRQAWNVMAEIGRRNPSKTMHEISLHDLMHYLNWGRSHNQDYLKETLLALLRSIVQWNILGKDKINVWGAMTMLSQVTIQDGKVSYAFPPELAEWLKQTNMYAKLDLQIQHRIDSKYGQALWELCVDAFDQNRGAGETPAIPLETFRKLMGVPESAYVEFKKLNAHVITEALKVVNEVTDFVVDTEFQRQGRKVTAIKFRIRRVPGKAKAVPVQQHLFPDEKDQPVVVRELKQAGIDSAEAWKIYQQGAQYIVEEFRPDMARYDADPERAMEKYVREKIELMKCRRAEGKIKSAAGFLHQAIRKNYQHPEAALKVQLSEQRRKAQESGQIKRRQDTLAYQREKLDTEREAALHEVGEAILRENQALLETAVSALTVSEVGFRHMYDTRKTAPENYKSPRVYLFVDQWLEGKYPERFAAVRAAYSTKAADFGQQSAALAQAGKAGVA